MSVLVRFPARSLGVFLGGGASEARGASLSRSTAFRADAVRICLHCTLRAQKGVHRPSLLAFRIPRRSNSCRKRRNIDLPSIVYAFRPRLRHRLTPGGRTCPGKPWDSGDRDSHPVFRYSCPHNHWHAVHRRFRARLRPCMPRSPTISRSANSAHGLTPDHFRRGISRPVSCYALFKWWLPLSQHPRCLSNFTSLST